MNMKHNRIVKKIVAFGGALLLGICAVSAEANQDFVTWLKDFYPEAGREGITVATYNNAFQGVTEPDDVVLERAAYQPEFVQEVWEYLDTRVNTISVSKGLEKKEQFQAIFDQLEKRFGIDRNILLAIWSMETNYGAVLERPERLHYVPQALATLGWGDEKRSKFARNQLVAALQILQAKDINRQNMLGSWAGAMGHTQFIPTSYLAYAVDMDGDGRRDIWNSVPDALATAANLLAKNGWRSGNTWGYEVKLPPGVGKYAEETRTIGQWQQMGITRPDGKPFPRPDEKAILKVLAGESGPGFLMVKNFFVIKRYNNSDKYALAVGMLADHLGGYGGLNKDWPRPADSLTADEKIELQRLLKDKGLYDGEVDGQLGTGSRAAIREFEKRAGLQVNGMPTRTVLNALRK
ncbi:lytic murein transglycosylase [Desulfopila aestuarii]|uniref:Membrane-bound lytic murein transglycosylase B n=1 Tax=Desulfopila aestuarii DSM 18488 TaxID=1121416 RepID=A0A1M7Y0D4_9BACT|nr:lytic murein transglycosylase [Desulfopila aestuarii]SHO44783.1 membrane-bound lytic murein transglycosylase B [Desulfopila aestuarii DSM 18488]